jgi:uncharacterized protein (TIGR02594 family)
LRVTLNAAALVGALLAANLAPDLAEASGRSGAQPVSVPVVWQETGRAGRPGRAAPALAPRFFGGGSDVVAEASRWIGSRKFTAPPGPWCADAVSAWLQRTGHRPLDSRMASAALAYGPQLSGPQVGALAVLGSRRGWAAHVGIVSGVESDGSIRLISGNWGARVAEAVISRRSVVAFVAVQ